jgi:hypothetical protein
MRKLATKLITAMTLAVTVSPAWAWGEREQGVLQGLAGAWILGRMLQNNEPQPQPPVVIQPPPPVYVYPAPQRYYRQPQCYDVPYYDHYGSLAYYRQVCR